MRRRWFPLCLAASVLALVPASGAVGLPLLPVPAPAPTRQAWLWPFSAGSPWNAGVGDGAVFEGITEPRTSNLLDSRPTPWVNAESYSHPIYRATAGDPVATVRERGRPDARYRIPAPARPAAGSDHHLHVVDPSGRYVEEAWLMQGANPQWLAGHHVTVDLQSNGLGNGTRAYGGSALGGLIRSWELDAGEIRHALALAISSQQLQLGAVWPASREDGDPSAYHGLVPMGTFAAIPTWVDLDQVGLSPEGLVVGRALQRYGAYVVDRSHGTFSLSAEPTVSGPALAHLRADIGKLRGWLRVVRNNGPDAVNGGGIHRTPPAPPFSG